MQLVLQ